MVFWSGDPGKIEIGLSKGYLDKVNGRWQQGERKMNYEAGRSGGLEVRLRWRLRDALVHEGKRLLLRVPHARRGTGLAEGCIPLKPGGELLFADFASGQAEDGEERVLLAGVHLGPIHVEKSERDQERGPLKVDATLRSGDLAFIPKGYSYSGSTLAPVVAGVGEALVHHGFEAGVLLDEDLAEVRGPGGAGWPGGGPTRAARGTWR